MSTTDELSRLTRERDAARANKKKTSSRRIAAKKVVIALLQEKQTLQKELTKLQQQLTASEKKFNALQRVDFTFALAQLEETSQKKHRLYRQQKELRSIRRRGGKQRVQPYRKDIPRLEQHVYWHLRDGFKPFNMAAHTKREYFWLKGRVAEVSQQLIDYETALRRSQNTLERMVEAQQHAQREYVRAEHALQLALGVDPLWHLSYSHEALMTLAEVDSQYWDTTTIHTKPTGDVQIYYGGIHHPLGTGHGHHTLNHKGVLVYKRLPFAPRGEHNFTAAYYMSKNQSPVVT